MAFLDKIKNVEDIKELNIENLPLLAEEVREKIISVTLNNGGHLASSLGAVDAIIALLYSFDFSKDKLIFDVGHQSYAYKILTDRNDKFNSLRLFGGISGFPLISESSYDSFSSGHAGDSLAASLGYCYARDKKKEDFYVVDFIGDGAFCNGEYLESLIINGNKPQKLLIVLNDNGMSISENVNGLFHGTDDCSLGSFSLTDGINFDGLGLTYIGPIDGHDIVTIISALEKFKSQNNPVVLHIKTQKGKGYEPAEKEAEFYHGVSKDFQATKNTFSDSLGKIICDKISLDDKIVTIVAGMGLGAGLNKVKSEFPDNFIDTGISEDFAITFASSLALKGLKPIVCIYSTFLQRGYDQIVTNVCLQNLPVVFLVDRAGLVGRDGYTHQGIFDTAYLSHIPNLSLFAPKNTQELDEMIDFAIKSKKPTAIRYPNGIIDEVASLTAFSQDDLWEVLKTGNKKCILACGPRALNLALSASHDLDVCVVNARTLMPLDTKFIDTHITMDFITIDDSIKTGGFSSIVSSYLAGVGYKGKLSVFAVPDKFVPQGSVEEQLFDCGITVSNIRKALLS